MEKVSKKPRFLILSALPPAKGGGGLVDDFHRAMMQEGFDVDILSPDSVKKFERVNFLARKFNRYYMKKTTRNVGFLYTFDQFIEWKSGAFLDAINKDYDAVLVLYTQGYISCKTMWDIYNKLKCQVHLFCVDFAVGTGGCHFPLDCERYKEGCGMCPVFGSTRKNDFSRYNARYRKRFFDTIKPVIYCNSYMERVFNESYVTADVRKVNSACIINTEQFHPRAVTKDLMQRYGVTENHDFVIFFGSQDLNEERKGMRYLLDSLKLFSESIEEEERKKVLVLVAGRGYDEIKDLIPFNVVNLGFLSIEQLAEVYSLSSVFLCPSVYEPGPMMVSQALCCGTPVVGFEMGILLDQVQGKNTGYCARLRDVKDFADGIKSIYTLDSDARKAMRERCRALGMDECSYTNVINKIYKEYQRAMI